MSKRRIIAGLDGFRAEKVQVEPLLQPLLRDVTPLPSPREALIFALADSLVRSIAFPKVVEKRKKSLDMSKYTIILREDEE